MPIEIPRGRFLWYELMTTDPDAAKSFYTRLIGWGTQPFEGGPTPYTMWTNQGQPMGGLIKLPEEDRKAGGRPRWLGYISTPNVDDTVAQAREVGGRVVMPAMDIPKVGRFALLTDPQGAEFYAFTPAPASGPPPYQGPPRFGDFSWHELVTTDHQAAFRFYQAVFAWEKLDEHDMGPMGTYLIYGRGGVQLGGMFKKPAEMPGPSTFVFYVRGGDVGRGAERAKELGGSVLNGPMEVPGGDHIVQLMDPQGAAFALHQKAERASSSA
jgi:uncharacterized protein